MDRDRWKMNDNDPQRTTRSQNGVLGQEAVPRAVLHAERHDAAALAIDHDQVGGKVLDEKRGLVLDRLPVQGVQHGVAGAVGRARGAVCLALAVVQRLAAKGALVDFAIFGTGKGQASGLQFTHGLGRLLAHVVDGVLVAEPIRPLDGVVHVPFPVVLCHVAQRGVDAALHATRHESHPTTPHAHRHTAQ